MRTLLLTFLMLFMSTGAFASPLGFFDFTGIYNFEITEEDASWDSSFGYVYHNDRRNMFEIFSPNDEPGSQASAVFTNKDVGFYYTVKETGKTYTTWLNNPSHIIWDKTAFYLDDNGANFDQDFNDMTVNYTRVATPIFGSIWLLFNGLIGLGLFGLKRKIH